MTATTMFKREIASNNVITWVLRVVGFIAMFIGLNLLLNLIAVLPFFGNIVGFSTFIIAATLSITTIVIAWIFSRPILGVTLFVIAGILYFLKFARKPQAATTVTFDNYLQKYTSTLII